MTKRLVFGIEYQMEDTKRFLFGLGCEIEQSSQEIGFWCWEDNVSGKNTTVSENECSGSNDCRR